MIEVSCDRADSTFAPSQQNAIKKLKLFLNNSPTTVTLQLSARLVQSYVIGFTSLRPRFDRYPTHTCHNFFLFLQLILVLIFGKQL